MKRKTNRTVQKILLASAVFAVTVLPSAVSLLYDPYALHLGGQTALSEAADAEDISEIGRGTVSDRFTAETVVGASGREVRHIELDAPDKAETVVGALLEKGTRIGTAEGRDVRLRERSRITEVRKIGKRCRVSWIEGEEISVDVEADEHYVNIIRSDSPAEAYAAGQTYRAELTAAGETVRDGCFQMKFLIYDPELLCRSGTRLRVSVLAEQKEDVLRVPRDCVSTDPEGRQYVLRKDEDGCEVVFIRTGTEDEAWYEVVSGLTEGDCVYGLADYSV